jgi:hypothetical protein
MNVVESFEMAISNTACARNLCSVGVSLEWRMGSGDEFEVRGSEIEIKNSVTGASPTEGVAVALFMLFAPK